MFTKKYIALAMLCLCVTALQAQDLLRGGLLKENAQYLLETQATFSESQTPIYLTANKFGLSSVNKNNGYIRAAILRPAETDSARLWRMGYGADFVVAHRFTASPIVQQLFADIEYKALRLSIGSKERAMNLKHQRLSTGSQTFGINARPIPEIRIELPNYLYLNKGQSIGIKGHVGYGVLTDGQWQKGYVASSQLYTSSSLYHSKSGFIKIGNESKFPLTFEGGLEMATMFGAKLHNLYGISGNTINMTRKFKDFWEALTFGGSDVTDGDYANVAGNTLGSWLCAISYHHKGWKIRAYADHFFEDHSMVFLQYGWKDALLGLEVSFPQNRFISTLVYEHISTKDQTGPLYHDHTTAIPDQISGRDNYYTHNINNGWQHWGQAIGNPLFKSPLYKENCSLAFVNNRFVAHHFGIEGHPTRQLQYRLLYTYTQNWGTYNNPYDEVYSGHSMLAELHYSPEYFGKHYVKGWEVSAAFAFDRGLHAGKQLGGQITIRKRGLLSQ